MSSFGIMWVPLLFGITLFFSSALLFLVQPMIGRTVLPHLGGNPIAWSVCLVFLQAMLLVGSVYADLLHRFRGLRWQPWLHLVALTAAIALCFVGLFGDDALEQLAPRLMSLEMWPIVTTTCLLIVTVALPMFALAALTPLLQRWFAHLDHPKSSDPYFLMTASSLGGLAALALYSLLIEPFTPLYVQWLAWKLAALALAGMVFLTALCAWRAPRSPELEPPERPSGPDAPLIPRLIGRGPATWRRRLRWSVASALPVALFLSLTDSLTTDLARAPALWSLPLVLYLFGFCQSFARFSPVGYGHIVVKVLIHAALGMMLALALFFLAIVLFSPRRPAGEVGPMVLACCSVLALVLLTPSAWLPIVQPMTALAVVARQANMAPITATEPAFMLLDLTCFYLTARLCLGSLAEDRPAAPWLTGYFGWIGLGGLCGGLVHLLLVPVIFSHGVLEFAFLAALATILRPAWSVNGLLDWLLCRMALAWQAGETARLRARIGVGFDLLLVLFTACLGAFVLAGFRAQAWLDTGFDLALVVVVLCVLVLYLRPLRFGLALAALVPLSFISLNVAREEAPIVQQRGAFGALQVNESIQPIKIKRADRWGEPIASQYTERALMHASTRRDICITDPPALLRYPTGIYHRRGPVGHVMRGMEWFRVPAPDLRGFGPDLWMQHNRDNAKGDARIAASLAGMLAAPSPLDAIVTAWSEPPYAFVGLGTGTTFAYAHPFQWVDAYEIDPALIALSTETPPVFHYYQSAQKRGAQASIIPGDGRGSLARVEREFYYHVILIDPFGADAVLAHLVTQEAIELYFRKLAAGGVVCINTANRHSDLTGVFEQTASRLGLYRKVLEMSSDDLPAATGSKWTVLGRDRASLERWTPVPAFDRQLETVMFPPNLAAVRTDSKLLWTDEHANPLAAAKPRQAWPSMIYGCLILVLFLSIFLGLIEIMFAMAPKIGSKR